MANYYLDANTLIQAKNGPYAMDVHETFWKFIDEKIEARVIASSVMVYKEWTDGNDDLAQWAKDRKDSGFFLEPTEQAQTIFGEIADYVTNNYGSPHVERFLAGADPWIIAQAKADGAAVVTHEVRVNQESRKVKIPNICEQFQVEWMNLYRMLHDLGAKF